MEIGLYVYYSRWANLSSVENLTWTTSASRSTILANEIVGENTTLRLSLRLLRNLNRLYIIVLINENDDI